MAELQTEVELFRGAIYAAVDAMMAGQNVTLHASMIKLKLGRICRCDFILMVEGSAKMLAPGCVSAAGKAMQIYRVTHQNG